MRDMLQFYIDGQWVDPETPNPFDVINPATEEVCGRISLGSAADVDKAEPGLVGLPDRRSVARVASGQYVAVSNNVPER